jgi:hypothetical protein
MTQGVQLLSLDMPAITLPQDVEARAVTQFGRPGRPGSGKSPDRPVQQRQPLDCRNHVGFRLQLTVSHESSVCLLGGKTGHADRFGGVLKTDLNSAMIWSYLTAVSLCANSSVFSWYNAPK